MERQHVVADVMAACPLFAGADGDDLAAIAAAATDGSWAAGSTIFQQGDPGDYLIIISSGRIKLSLASAAGRELTIRHAGPGAVVGEMGVLDHETRSADATADMATTGLVIRRPVFERMLAARPGLARAVIRYLSKRLRETTYQLESVALYELTARLARFLIATLRQLHAGDLPATAILRLELDQSEIAAILGASRPKLNRALAELAERGAIRRTDKLVECNVAQLEAIAEADET